MKIILLGPAPIVSGIDSIGNYILDKLKYYGSVKGRFRFVAAYAQETFMNIMGQALEDFVRAGGATEAIVGIDSHGTSEKALKSLHSLMGPSDLFVYHNPADGTFHPKLYMFESKTKACVIVGSSNLTSGGLVNNFEVNVAIELNPNQKYDRQVLQLFNDLFSSIKGSKSSKLMNSQLLTSLKRTKCLQKRGTTFAESNLPALARTTLRTLFQSTYQKRIAIPTPKTQRRPDRFIMSLASHDVSGAREPYFLVPVTARDQNPKFWGWQRKFVPSQRGRFPERHFQCVVHINSTTTTEQGRLYYVGGRTEFRFKCAMIHYLGRKYAGSFIILTWKRLSSGQDIAKIKLITQKNREYARLAKLPFNVHTMGKKWIYA